MKPNHALPAISPRFRRRPGADPRARAAHDRREARLV